jgi:hypothetical protein
MSFKKIISTLLLATLTLPNIAIAQSVPSPDAEPAVLNIPPPELTPGEKDPGLAISPMKRGQRAPFTGVLLAPASVASVIVEIESIHERMQIEIRKAVEQERAECEKTVQDLNVKTEADNKIHQANIDGKNRTINMLNQRVKKLEEENASRWHPGVWIGIGTAGGIALTVLTAFAISKATQ